MFNFFFDWVIPHWHLLMAAITKSSDAYVAWKALLDTHQAKLKAIDPSSPTAAADTEALNKQSANDAMAFLKEYAPVQYAQLVAEQASQ